MGTFVFRWPHAGAKEVYATGTFDDWGKTVKLERVNGMFEKKVTLLSADEKILYKFVVDDSWLIDHDGAIQDDGRFYLNNVIYPSEIENPGAKARPRPSADSETAAVEAYIDRLLKEEPATSPDTEQPEHLDEWVLCHRVNLHFYVINEKKYDCLACHKNIRPSRGQLRTDFLQRVICSAGHDAHLNQAKGLCSDCDTDTILQISKRKQKCFDPECGQPLTVDEPLIEWNLQRVKAQTNVLKGYLDLLNTHSKFECIACCEDIAINSELCPTRRPTTLCTHDIEICSVCFEAHLRASIKPRTFAPVRCPSSGCNQLMTLAGIQLLAPKDLFQQYEHSAFLNKISTDPHFRWCTNPSDACRSGQLHPAGDASPCWTCTNCNWKNCFTEKTRWHEGQSCEQHWLSSQFDSLSYAEIRRRTKKCPNQGCSARIEKNKLCKDMHCKPMPGGVGGCGRTFCWECKIIYDANVAAGGGSQHLASCRFRYDRKATVVPRPSGSNALYAKGWDRDEGYVGAEDDSWRPWHRLPTRDMHGFSARVEGGGAPN